MKRILYLGLVVVLASCSSPRYAANFQKSAPGFGYGELITPARVSSPTVAPQDPSLLASTNKETGIITTPSPADQAAALDKLRSDYQQLSKSEKKEFRKELKNQISKMTSLKKKDGIESVKSVKNTKMLDHDLKLAAIFGAIGIVALIISGNVFYIIGGIALIIGVVFFVMWLVRQ